MHKFLAAALSAVLIPLFAPSATVTASTAEPGTTARVTTARAAGTPQKIFGPSGDVDSPYSTVRDAKGRLHGYLSNYTAFWFDQRANGSLANRRVMLQRGRRGAIDQCGVHPGGTIYKASRTHWITFYHAEKGAPADHGTCNHANRHTRWSIVKMETFNAGRSWVKRGQVITQDRGLMKTAAGGWKYATDDTGSPRLVVDGKFMYLFYRATNRTSGDLQEMTIARAPRRSLGKPGAWKKYYEATPPLQGTYSQPGLGGRSSGLPTALGQKEPLPGQARGISFNSHLNKWLAVEVGIEGITLYQSTDLLHWEFLEQPWKTGLTESAWHKPCGRKGLPVAYGYGSIVGLNGASDKSGQTFWVYYMKKPAGQCFDSRYLYRRKITLPSIV
jgi:hypothetical protein